MSIHGDSISVFYMKQYNTNWALIAKVVQIRRAKSPKKTKIEFLPQVQIMKNLERRNKRTKLEEDTQ